MITWVWLNGRFVDGDKPHIRVFDHGFLYGDGVYETLRVYGGRAFLSKNHWRRLRRSARGLGLAVPFSDGELEAMVPRLLARNQLKEAVVRVSVSRGPGPLGFDPRPCHTPTVVALAVPPWPLKASLRERGCVVKVTQVRRMPAAALSPAMKTTNNLNNILAKREAIRAKAFEAVMLNTDGDLAEGTVSNLFFVSQGRLQTPALDCGILDGVTRRWVIDHARRHGWTVEEGHYPLKNLLSSSDAFLTSTVMEVAPIRRVIDPAGRSHRLGSGTPGPLTQILMKDFSAALKGFTKV